MKFTPKEISDNDNVSKESPLRVFLQLAGGIVVIIVSVVVVLSLIVEAAVTLIPYRLDEQLGRYLAKMEKPVAAHAEDIAKLQKIVDGLVDKSALKGNHVRITIVDMEQLNAFAWPGHHIGVTSKLVKDVTNENELASIISHELGHIVYKDHLRAMGNMAVMMGVFGVVFSSGIAPDFSKGITGGLDLFILKYSRAQEQRADMFGLDLVHKRYGHVEGFVEVMKKLDAQDREHYQTWSLFSTHPASEERIKYLNERIKSKNYSISH